MPSNYAIGSLGYPSLGTTDYQALAAIMNTPNPNAQVSSRGNTQTTQATTQPQAQYVQQPEKKNNKAAWVLGGIAVLGAAACIYGFKKGNTDLKGLERIKDGLKAGWNSLTGKAANATTKAAETAQEAVTKGKNTIAEINGKNVVTLAGEKNVIYAAPNKKVSAPDAKAILDKVALDVPETRNIADRVIKDTNKLMNGNELLNFRQVAKVGKGCNKTEVQIIGAYNSKGEQIITVLGKDSKGKFTQQLLDGAGLSSGKYKEAVAIAKDIFSGKTDLATVDRILIKNTDKATGAVSRIESKKGVEKLLSVVTDRFSLNSNKVKCLRTNNSSFDKAVTEFLDKGGKNLGILRADVPITGGPTFTIDNKGNVLAIKYEQGKKTIIVDKAKDPELFGAKMFDFREQAKSIPNVKPEKWENRVFEAVL